MPNKKPAMICESCRIEMVHHAEKPVDPHDAKDVQRMDVKLGILIEEIHTCPGCGRCASRPGD